MFKLSPQLPQHEISMQPLSFLVSREPRRAWLQYYFLFGNVSTNFFS
tara:strand:+ start:778 stop:918 length:141 start_codon:yes stop_codon:yes gene_type:complete